MTEIEKSSSENLVPRKAKSLNLKNPGNCGDLEIPGALRRAVLQRSQSNTKFTVLIKKKAPIFLGTEWRMGEQGNGSASPWPEGGTERNFPESIITQEPGTEETPDDWKGIMRKCLKDTAVL